ncbi:serine hydrolase [Mongoliitalea daihaiensis]|uniref:serine hydrolase n=1 Tax=Mongoliitalea daihaiensis TaxID=2782006 RepID=UPI001F320781|nr:serine hydrolase [Mongoliitalea daihaiensis]UJP65808.1 serine hydrolase [Mongoliitalea daihaiensis]
MKRFFALLFIPLLVACGKPEIDVPFQSIPEAYPTLKKVLENPEQYQVQILFSTPSKDISGQIQFTDHSIALDDDKYFYPASTVKLPVALLALEWLESLDIHGLTTQSIMITDSVRNSQTSASLDSTALDNLPSIEHYIKKILLVSDNDAYNRLYELLGQDYINQSLQAKGLVHTVINHRLSLPMSEEENRHVNPIKFYSENGDLLYSLEARHTEVEYKNADNPTIGKAFYQGGMLVEKPMDFTYKNKFALSDLHGVVKRIVFPEAFPVHQRFKISEESRLFVLKYMGMLPGESDYPSYQLPEYYDSYSKFFMFGRSKEPMPKHIRILNKTGWAYGHLLDGAYVVDLNEGVEFLVSAVIYVNENETLNDDNYQYETIGLPFFAELGDYLYQRQLNLPKSNENYPINLKELFETK